MKALKEWKDRLETINKGQVAVFLHGDHPDRFVYRSWKDGHLNVYVSIFTSYDLDGEDSRMWTKEELYDDTYMFITSYPVFAVMMRKLIKDEIIDAAESDGTITRIRTELEADGGKIVKSGGKYCILAGAVSSDEDYYYLLVTEGGGIEYDTCVGKYRMTDVFDETEEGYKKIAEYKKELEIGANVDHLILNVVLKLAGGRDVLFTPLYLPGVNDTLLTFFNEECFGSF